MKLPWTVQESSTHIERHILLGMIVSDECLRVVSQISPQKYLETDFARTVSGWVTTYYARYKRAPGPDIQTIYEAARRDGLREDQSVLIGKFLGSIAEEFERLEQFNVQYAIDQAHKYFKERALRQIHDNLGRELEKGNLLRAQAVVAGYQDLEIASILGSEPLKDLDRIKVAFSGVDELFTLPGALGSMIGVFERDWLVGAVATYKRGKTSMMLYFAQQALANRLNVAWFNFEMGDNKMYKRIFQALTGLPSKPPRQGEYFYWPIWDCGLNQTGNCSRPERIATGALRDDKTIATYDKNPNWIPCTACYELQDSDYQTDNWVKPYLSELLTWKTAWEKAQAVVDHIMGARFKLQSWPKYSAGFADLHQTLHIWESMDGFKPDVIIADQPSAWKDEGKEEGRNIVDRQWKQLSGLGQEKHALVFAGSQAGGKDTLDLFSLRQKDVGEDSRLLGHVDGMIAKNQTDLEKKLHRARYAATAAREEEFNIRDEVVVLQQLAFGQAVLDSRFRNSSAEKRRIFEKKFRFE